MIITKHGKKLLAILALVLALTLVFCSCGGKKDAKAEDETKITGTAETGDTPADTDEPDEIEIDGGINLDNVCQVKEAGCDIIVAGSAVFGAEDIPARTRAFCEKLV